MKLFVKYFIIFLLLAIPSVMVVAQFVGKAPVLSNVTISDLDDNSVVVEWETDVNTDAVINYGLNEYHGIMRYPLYDKKKHKIVIDKLEPSTTYHFRVVSSDSHGNRSTSGGFVFTTKGIRGIPGIEEIRVEEERALAEKIVTALDGIYTPEAAEFVLEQVDRAVESILGSSGGGGGEGEEAGMAIEPPSIVGAPNVEVATTEAEIRWFTNRESSTMVYLASEQDYDAESAQPYNISQGVPDEFVTEHLIKVIGLKPSTTYHFQAVSEDRQGFAGRSRDFTFTTKSILPVIRNVRILKVEETSATVAWTTDVIADSLVEYTNTRTNETKFAGDPSFVTSHNIRLVDLEFGTRYSAIIKSQNEAGDQMVSDRFTFITVKDELAPIISKVNNESTLFPGEEIKIQTIVSWETDEPSLCQFFYTQGLAGADDGDSLPKELNPVAEHVQVVVGFAPSTVYRFWLKCEDLAGNSTRSEDFVLFTPQKEKSIIDIILENFEGTFGWVKNITN